MQAPVLAKKNEEENKHLISLLIMKKTMRKKIEKNEFKMVIVLTCNLNKDQKH